MHENKPLLAITMGDPAGCGPEIVAKAAISDVVRQNARLLCIGDLDTLRQAFATIGSDMQVAPISSVRMISSKPGELPILDLSNVDRKRLQIGKVQRQGGQAAYEYIIRSIDLALEGSVDAVVTAPINKEALHLAGHEYDGHTEIFARRTNTEDVAMMLASGHFRVTHISTHVSLQDAIRQCTFERIVKVIQLTVDGLIHLGIPKPRLAVAGLNPHSGENGIFGSEEIDVIQPAIEDAIQDGIDIVPYPVPPDTVFVRMQEQREFDAVIAQYHDQGHIPAKLVDFWGGVNITLGLPIIRTSVDHGTAFDIAGTGKARPDSLINAILFACTMHTHWKDRNDR